MNILLLNHFPCTGSGSGVYTKNIADSLIKQGHKICIIMPENQIINNIDNNIKLHPVYFTGSNNIEKALPFNFPCFTTHPRSNVNFSDLDDDKITMYIDKFKEAIEDEIKTFKPDIIHAGHIWVLPSLVSHYNIPLIITTHGTDLIGYKEIPKLRCYADKAIEKANKIIAISNDNKSLVEKIFPNYKNKICIIPNGFNSNLFYQTDIKKESFLKTLNIHKNYNKIVCFVGKFTEIKGIDILLKAASIYEKEDILTILAGDGNIFNKMKEMAHKLKLKNVVFIGNQPHDVLNKLYNVSNVSIIPSRSEAFGLVVIEAMACGTPVIGSNIGGIKDIINDKVGYLFKCNDYKDLAEKINNILNNNNFNKNYIAKYAKDNFSQDIFIKQLITIYNQAIKDNENTSL